MKILATALVLSTGPFTAPAQAQCEALEPTACLSQPESYNFGLGVLVAGPVPDEVGFFSYGLMPTSSPFGNGTLCLAAPTFTLPITTVTAGELGFDVDFTNLPSGGAITPGSTWYFQATFRDSAAGGAMFDTSDGTEVVFGP